MEPDRPTPRDHLANERTLLAWVRTSVTIVGLGFIVDRLAAEGQATVLETWGGVALVLFGAVLAAAGAYSYLRAERDLEAGVYRPAVTLNVLLVGIVGLVAIGVAVLLILY